MRFVQALFATLLIGAAIAGRLRSEDSLLSKLPNANYKWLVNDISALISSGAPVDDILDLLAKIRDDVVSDQVSHDEQHSREQEDCATNIAELNEKIEGHKNNIFDAKQRILEYTFLISQTKQDISQHETRIEQTESAIAVNAENTLSAISERSSTHDLYLEQRQDHIDAIDAIDEVVEILQSSPTLGSNESPNSLVQKSVNRASSALIKVSGGMKRSASRSIKTKGQLLQSLLSASGPGDFKKLIDLLHRLQDELSESLEEIEHNESVSKAAFDSLIEDLTAEKEQLESTLSALETAKAQLEELLIERQEALRSQEKRQENEEKLLESTEHQLANTIADCEAKAAFYESETARRTEEIATIDECKDIIVEQLAPNLGNARLN